MHKNAMILSEEDSNDSATFSHLDYFLPPINISLSLERWKAKKKK